MSIAALVVARWLQFAATTLLVGGALFPFYGLPRHPGEDTAALTAGMRRLLAASAVVTTISAFLWVGASLVDLADDVGGLYDAETLREYFLETSFGRVWALRLILAVALSVVTLGGGRCLFARNGVTALVAALAAALMASQALIGHPASLPVSERWIVAAAYGLHVLGAAIWLGALPPLGFLVARALRAREGLAAAEVALRRFSPIGMFAVAALLLGGVVNALSRAAAFDAFLASTWGRLVVFKFLVASAMIMAALLNRFILTPRLPLQPKTALLRLARNVALEQAAGLAILAASSLLAVFHPPGMHHQ